MSFTGRVKDSSHEGGLLVSFDGRPPRLGARIRISGGKILGRVEGVLGPVDDPLIHIHPVFEGINTVAAIGSPVEIAPRSSKRAPVRKRRGEDRRSGVGKHTQRRRGGQQNRTSGKRGPRKGKVQSGHKRVRRDSRRRGFGKGRR